MNKHEIPAFAQAIVDEHLHGWRVAASTAKGKDSVHILRYSHI